MKNAEQAIIDGRKLADYALNPSHPVGGNKAKVFEKALGYTKDNADQLLAKIRQGVKDNPALAGKVDEFGRRYNRRHSRRRTGGKRSRSDGLDLQGRIRDT